MSDRLAQGERIEVSGTVLDDTDGIPLPGVSIAANGTPVGVTNQDGKFQLSVEKGAVLSFSYIGYRPGSVTVNQPNGNISVRLKTDNQQLSEVVVTALGIKREEKALGYATTTVQGEALTQATPNNWTDALSGKVAGLNMIKSGGGPGGSNKIILRGENSLAGDSEALIVIDGVVTGGSNRQTGTGSSAYLQSESPVDFGSGLNDINPDDIESVSVLKGPGATALYGARGANGAIIITTKSGTKRQKGIGVTINSNTSIETISRWPDYQYEFGQGTNGANYYSFLNTEDGASTRSTSSAWGPRFDGQMFYQYDPETRTTGAVRTPWVPYENNRKDFFQTGKTFTNSVTLDGANDKTSVRFSLTNLKNDWIIPNTGYNRNTVALSAGHNVTDKLRISTKVNYTNKYTDNLPSTGYNNQSLMYWLMFQVPNADLNWLKQYWEPGQEGIVQNYPFSSLVDNPYLITYEMLNKSNRNTVTGNVQATYDFNQDLSLMVRTAIDFSYEARSQQRPKDTEKFKEGMFWTQNIFSQELNSDFLLRYGKAIGDKFDFSISAGGSRMTNRYNRDQTRANRLLYPNVFNFANSADVLLAYPYRSEYAVNSLYALGTFSYNEWLFLDLTARQDWTSTLATPGIDRSLGFFYPSASVSTIVSELVRMPSFITFAKLRGSFAEVGSGTTRPYQTAFTYATQVGFPGGLSNPSAIANPNLRPLRTQSLEFGADLRFFNNRLGVDVSVYQNNTFDQILSVPIDRASGYSAAILNAGEVQNKGIEVQANASPFKNKEGLTWKVTGTFSANRNKVVELADSLDTYQMQRGPGGRGSVEARPGATMGDIYGRGYLRSPDGQIIYENGYPVLGDEMILLGNTMPKWKAGIGNQFNFKQFGFNILFDGSFGAKAYSLTHAVLADAGKLEKTIPGRYNGIIGNGVIANGDGSYRPNDVIAEDIWTYYNRHFGRDNVEGNLFSTDYIKLREVRLDYRLPSNLLSRLKLQKASIGVYGRDLFMWTHWPAFDPEFGTLNDGTIDAGFELGQFPATRTMGVNLTIGI
ncbi:SusC/RagA family TonB-linked outer membrane protein [uncultured Pontibacter sp.]|uniref:SusC/RagA family TonB-linked outer membrane protein n=1 Tax=uncultured Pontibacter sp. TaxID=453356 RepID=UPI00260AF146|nr:SusC/RagA family TonB-linked outer membrane protein [uncultured Pontibacter sp.]